MILALLIMALATITAVAMSSRQQLDIQRTANLLNHDQAYAYVLGAEDWARQILLQQTNPFDSLDQIWAMQLPPLPVLGGSVQARLYDVHNCFNLNNLLNENENLSLQQQYLENLMRLLDISTWLVADITAWINANAPIVHHSELAILLGWQDYAKLQPYICALPGSSRININTAPLEILLSLNPAVNIITLQELLNQREEQPFQTVEQFLQHPAYTGLQVATELISVNSAYFRFVAQAKIGGGSLKIESLLHRHNKQVELIYRTM